jgi:CDGSH-type Zn-finger protein
MLHLYIQCPSCSVLEDNNWTSILFSTSLIAFIVARTRPVEFIWIQMKNNLAYYLKQNRYHTRHLELIFQTEQTEIYRVQSCSVNNLSRQRVFGNQSQHEISTQHMPHCGSTVATTCYYSPLRPTCGGYHTRPGFTCDRVSEFRPYKIIKHDSEVHDIDMIWSMRKFETNVTNF